MKRAALVVLGLAVAVLAIASLVQADDAAKKPTDGLFLHVSHGVDDPHRLLMALKMAGTMAEAGRPVLVYCDIKAVAMLAKDAPDVALEPFPSSRAQIAHLVELGVRLRACPTCLKAAGLAEKDLTEGVKLADREEFYSFTPGRILTLDY